MPTKTRPADFGTQSLFSGLGTAVPAAPTRTVYSVSRLNREVRGLLESGLGALWVQGEISNLSRPASGHWYFSLKDRDTQVRCAMFRQRNSLARFSPREGQLVQAYGRVSLYEARGDYQLLVELLEDAGVGALQRAFDELKARLAAEGLFAPERKRPLPPAPRRIGVITSPTGAAVRDILHILGRRFPCAPVLIYPAPVQGATAVAALIAALELAGARAECDVLILARGGGSLEDLWAFNDEGLARAILRCPIPVVTGIGHEIDFTIADFVADLRAPTPTGAAQLVAPDASVWRHRLVQFAARFAAAARRTLRSEQTRLDGLVQRLRQAHPGARLLQHSQRLDELE
ncbi:MAG: exodeoxyribonuclease VII large subunit, partial [Steroidobacteraceae bacterium]